MKSTSTVKTVRKMVLFVLKTIRDDVLLPLADLLMELGIPGWDFIKMGLCLFPFVILSVILIGAAIILSYVFAILECMNGRYVEAAFAFVGGTTLIVVLTAPPAPPRETRKERAWTSFREKSILPLLPQLSIESRSCYDTVISARDIEPEMKVLADGAVWAAVEGRKRGITFTADNMRKFLEEHHQNADAWTVSRLISLAEALDHMT